MDSKTRIQQISTQNSNESIKKHKNIIKIDKIIAEQNQI